MGIDIERDKLRTSLSPSCAVRPLPDASSHRVNSWTATLGDIRDQAVGLSRPARMFLFDIAVIIGKEKFSGYTVKTLYVGETIKPSFRWGKYYTHSEAVEKYDNYMFIIGSVYADYHIAQKIKNVFGFNLKRWIERFESQVDLIILDIELPYSASIDKSQYVALPQWVRQKFPMGNTWEEVTAKFRKNLSKELKQALKQGYYYFVSNSAKHFKQFYNEMYVPYTQERFDQEAVIYPLKQIMKYKGQGDILFLVQNGHVILASLSCYVRNSVNGVCWAAADGHTPATVKGGFVALNYFWILNAFEKGCDTADFLGSRPLLENGAFRFKRKWGTFAEPLNIPGDNIYLKACNFSPGTKSFLTHNPLITVMNRKLVGKVLSPGRATRADVERCAKRYSTAGIDHIAIFCCGGMDESAKKYALSEAVDVRLYDVSRSALPEKKYCRF